MRFGIKSITTLNFLEVIHSYVLYFFVQRPLPPSNNSCVEIRIPINADLEDDFDLKTQITCFMMLILKNIVTVFLLNKRNLIKSS